MRGERKMVGRGREVIKEGRKKLRGRVEVLKEDDGKFGGLYIFSSYK